MTKVWPSDTMTKQRGRKDPPRLQGWTYHESKTNLFTICAECKTRAREMFYKYERAPGASVGITTAICLSCAEKKSESLAN